MNGTLLWFNEVKDCGLIATEDGERLRVQGDAFPEGRAIAGNCTGLPVSFEREEGEVGPLAAEVSLVQVEIPRRARRRRRS